MYLVSTVNSLDKNDSDMTAPHCILEHDVMATLGFHICTRFIWFLCLIVQVVDFTSVYQDYFSTVPAKQPEHHA